MTILDACRNCPCFNWCKSRGCIAWNEQSRQRYFELKERSDESNRFIDSLEELFNELP